jgi:DNA topoisomerase-3
MFQRLVIDYGFAKVIDVSEKEERKSRPVGLNTVNLLKVIFHFSL